MNFVLDIILLAIIALSVVSGYKKGFVKTLFHMTRTVLAFLAAAAFTRYLAPYVKRYLLPGAPPPEPAASSGAQDGIAGMLEGIGQDLLASGKEAVAGTVREILANAVAFLILFLAALILLKIVELVVSLVFRLPLLKETNKVLGLFMGFLSGLFLAAVFCMVAEMAIPYLNDLENPVFKNLNPEQGTILYRHFCAFDLFGRIKEWIFQSR